MDSKDEQIKNLNAALDKKQREIDRLQAELADVKRELELEQRLAGGAIPAWKETMREIMQERDEFKELCRLSENVVRQTTPVDAIFAEQVEPGTIVVGMSVVFQFSPIPEDWRVIKDTKVFRGTLEDAVNQVIPTFVLRAGRVPEAADIGGKLDGIPDGQIMQILHNLATYWNTPEYQVQRLAQFKEHWPLMQATKLHSMEDARTRFYFVIDRSFKNAEKRQVETLQLLTPESLTKFVRDDGEENG